ncbi:uncharacterized protein LOC112506114 [Cynara cardunculus var. scolymus]|uniref:uncharacterized protein LOC112506114 n=1 Tax=Cynara cardunculus var. scolymus TaxID=59895 RepID=UPI000D623654|nr:uncharacterized protein LOC112506114 [Cynara cardunculus var. scolymus]
MEDNPPPREATVNIADDKNRGIRDYATAEFGQLAAGREEDEAVSDAWERFKDLLRKCPHHGIPHCIQLETFYNGLSSSAKIILDATTGGAFTAKTYNEGHDILERISNNNTEWSNPRPVVSKSALGIHEIDVISALNAQIVALTNLVKNNLRLNGENNKVQSKTSNPPMSESCVFCGEGHSYEYFPENPVSVNYVGSDARNSSFSPTYNSNWKNHPNFSWTGNLGLQPPKVTQVQNRPQNPLGYWQGFINQTNATLRSFETQLGQFVVDLKGRPLGTFPSDTETLKGKEHIKVVTVLSEESSKVNDDTSETVKEPTHQNEVSHAFDMSNFPILSPSMEETQKYISVQKTVPVSTSSNVQLSAEKPDSGKIVPTV